MNPATSVNLTIVNKTYSNLTINWDLLFDEGTNKTSYIVQIYDELNLCAVIEDLEESTKYIIKIKAKNKYGTSNWSNLIQVKTEEYNYTASGKKLIFLGYSKSNVILSRHVFRISYIIVVFLYIFLGTLSRDITVCHV